MSNDLVLICLLQHMAAAGLRIVTISPPQVEGPQPALGEYASPFRAVQGLYNGTADFQVALRRALGRHESQEMGSVSWQVFWPQFKDCPYPPPLSLFRMGIGFSLWEQALLREYLNAVVIYDGQEFYLEGVAPRTCIVSPLDSGACLAGAQRFAGLVKCGRVVPSMDVQPSDPAHRYDLNWGFQ